MTTEQTTHPLACFSDDLRYNIDQHFRCWNENCEFGDEIIMNDNGIFTMICQVVEDGDLLNASDVPTTTLPDGWNKQIQDWCAAHANHGYRSDY